MTGGVVFLCFFFMTGKVIILGQPISTATLVFSNCLLDFLTLNNLIFQRKIEASDDIENISSTARRKRKRIKSKKEKLPKHDIVARGELELDEGSSSDSPDEKQEPFKDREKRESDQGDTEIDCEYEDQIQVTSDEVVSKTEESINDVENQISSGEEKAKKSSEKLDTNNKSEAFVNPQNELLIVQTNNGMFYSDLML